MTALPRRLRRALRRLRLRAERTRLAARSRELGGLVDVPHDIAEAARERLDRLRRRAQAIDRIVG
jgi:hypothetical protein